jgi:hypothetical protein
VTLLDPPKEWTPDQWQQLRKERDELRHLTAERIRSLSPDEIWPLSERSWAAGFFDGEGHAGIQVRDDLEHSSPHLVLHVTQAEDDGRGIESLERFKAAVAAGKIVPKSMKGAELAGQAQYRWIAVSERDMAITFAAIGPFVSLPKFAQLKRALTIPALRAIRSDIFSKPGKRRDDLTMVEVERERKPGADDTL